MIYFILAFTELSTRAMQTELQPYCANTLHIKLIRIVKYYVACVPIVICSRLEHSVKCHLIKKAERYSVLRCHAGGSRIILDFLLTEYFPQAVTMQGWGRRRCITHSA